MKFSHICRILGVCLCLSYLQPIHSFAQGKMANTVPYTVQPGENLYRIAQRHGITLSYLLQLNPGLQADHVQSNSVINVPASKQRSNNGSTSAQPQASRNAAKTTPQDEVPFKEYKVKRRDTAYSLAKANNITVDDLMNANPDMKREGYKLKKGTIIRIPLRKMPSTPKYIGLNPIHVAVVLPFIGTGVENERSVEFYRGLLMGIEELKKNKTNVFVSAYNEPSLNTSIAQLMTQVMKGNPDVIVGPLYPTHFNDVTSVSSSETKVAIPFSSKVPQVNYRPDIFVINTPSAHEVELATELFVRNFKKQTNVIFLHSANGNKKDFSQTLQNKLVSAGYNIESLPASSTGEQIQQALQGKQSTHFVLIPDDSSEAELNQLLPKMAYLRTSMPQTQLSLIGYNDWILLSEGAYKNKFHEADTYILSSNYYFPYTAAAQAFSTKYEKWFKSKLIESYPRMAPLGYDFSIGFLGGLSTYGHAFNTQSPKPNTLAARPKLQNEIRFKLANPSGGYVGRSMILVHFKKDLSITKTSAL